MQRTSFLPSLDPTANSWTAFDLLAVEPVRRVVEVTLYSAVPGAFEQDIDFIVPSSSPMKNVVGMVEGQDSKRMASNNAGYVTPLLTYRQDAQLSESQACLHP